MRTIKFRAWDIKENRLIYEQTMTSIDGDGDEHDYMIILSPYSDEEYLGITTSCVYEQEIKGEIERAKGKLMQFTGLKDKNGKEIYEGDIVKQYKDEGLGIIKWINSGLFCEYQSEEGGYSELDIKECKVIGNIYENPEIIKGDKE